MSSLSIPSASTALPAVNIHPHGHEHKKGAQLDLSGDSSSSSTAAQLPAGSTQNMFGTLFNSLAQLIGARPAPTGNPGAESAAAAANAASANIASASSRINLRA